MFTSAYPDLGFRTGPAAVTACCLLSSFIFPRLPLQCSGRLLQYCPCVTMSYSALQNKFQLLRFKKKSYSIRHDYFIIPGINCFTLSLSVVTRTCFPILNRGKSILVLNGRFSPELKRENPVYTWIHLDSASLRFSVIRTVL